MTIVFPYAGGRGGYFHSGAALQPLFWALVPVGFNGFIHWGKNHRGWDVRGARRVFGTSLVVISLFLSTFIIWQWLIGSDLNRFKWNEPYRLYSRAEQELQEFSESKVDVVMVNNPPGYYSATGRWAIVIPDGDLQATLTAGSRYNASYLLLDENSPRGLESLYENPVDQPGLIYLKSIEGMQLFALALDP
jgi:hypothetical protein